MKTKTRMRLLGAVWWGMVVMIPSPLWAQEAIDQEESIPSSVDEVITPMERSFKERIPPFGVIPWIREQLKNTPPFFRDSKIDGLVKSPTFLKRRLCA